MRPPADTVAAFFGSLLARQWDLATSLLDPLAVERYKDALLGDSYGLLNLDDRGEAPHDATLAHELASQPGPEGLGTSTVAEAFALPATKLVERLLSEHCVMDDGTVQLPWFAKRIAILGERLIGDLEAEVTYAYVDQSPHEVNDDTAKAFQRPWTIRLRAQAGQWRMAIPDALLPRRL